MHLFDWLPSAPSFLLEPFSSTPTLEDVDRLLKKHYIWRHEFRRRSGESSAGRSLPWLVPFSQGRPESVFDAYRCEAVKKGLYDSVPGLAMRIVVLAELPRTRETLPLRLLGVGRVLREAIQDLNALPPGAWERSVAEPVLLHFRAKRREQPASADTEEEQMDAEFETWYRNYQQEQAREREAAAEREKRGEERGARKGERALLERQLRKRFGDLPPEVTSRLGTATVADFERWAERILDAKTLAGVFSDD
jgi:hypothetical protein